MADDRDNKKDVPDKEDDIQAKNENLSKSDYNQIQNKENDTQVKDNNLSKSNDNQAQNKQDDAQVKNELNAIRAQVTATNNPAELARLASAAAGLASSTNNRELLDQIKNLQSSISKKEENAEQIIYSEDSEKGLNMEDQSPEAIREHQEHIEREARIEKNWTEYEKIKKESLDRLKEDNKLLDQMINNPNSLTEEQKRLARGEYLNEEERKEAERKAQQDIDFAKRTYELKKDISKSIEHEQKQIDGLKEKIELEQNPQQKEALLQKQQQHQTRININKERSEKDINPVIVELDLRRQNLVKLAEISPELAKKKIEGHFKGNIDRYKNMKVQDPDFKGLDEMYELVQKAGLEKKLGIEKEIAEYQKTKASKSSDIEQNPKTINNPQDPILSAQEKYGKNNIPPEVNNNITEKKIIWLGYEKDIKVIKGKLPAVQISSKSNQIDKPYPTPAIAKFAARAEAMNKKKVGREI
ncbi:MAG TPA: hypothetical protein LFV90_05970 [Rickettsia endosymbiont of Columbicola hoogstraali]|nr:hypothetical protein [Rickettsia endosymbiont of Columbicola hoogstraali]